MIPLSTAVSSGMTWSKLPRTRIHELKRNNEVLGTVDRPSIWSSAYVAESRYGRWRFRPGGWFGTGAEIVDAASGQQLATFKASWGRGGNLAFADGATYQIGCRGWWRPVWSVSTDSGQPVLSLHAREKAVDLPAAGSVPENRLVLLALFTLYGLLRAEEEAAATATFAAS